MTVRHSRIIPAIFSAVSFCAVLPSMVHADPAAPAAAAPSADAVQQPYYALINQDNVYIRSGPSDVFYATAKLNKGAKVTVVATRDPWLKIVPPEGSFCYVARAYVEKRGDGTVGRVTKNDLNVRAGSSLNGLKTTVLTSLSEGDDVKIVGEQSEYFKIAPPPGAYLYVMKTFADPAPVVAEATPPVVPAPSRTTVKEPLASEPIPPAITPPPGVTPVIPPVPAAPVAQVTPPPAIPAVPPVAPAPIAPAPVAPAPIAPAPVAGVPAAPAPVAPVASAAPVAPPLAAVVTPPTPVAPVTPTLTPSTQPSLAAAVLPATQPSVAIATPATQPVEPPADVRFGDVEATFAQAASLPLDKQPLDQMLSEYTRLSTDSTLPSSMRRIAQRRVATIQLRSDACKQYLEAQKLDAQAKARSLALKAEQQELEQKAKENQVAFYTVLGTLRISSLQQSGATLYRLTDPGTGRTLVYLKSNDPKYAGMLNQFVGVNGDITEDPGLTMKVITPTSVDAVDQSKVNTNVTATVMPPSLLPKTATASVSN
jgi:hypothetical protein